MKKITIQDLALHLNISFSTVARALNDHPAISPATKKRVKEAATRLHYRPNKLASSLRSGKTHVIGVIVPSLHVSFFSSVVHGIDKVMNEHQYSLLLYQSNESLTREIKGIDTFLRSRVDGIIASITRETSHAEHYEEIRKRRVPLVLFDRTVESLDVPSVRIDDYRGGFMATEHLILQGYRNILHITAEQDLTIVTERLRGYKDALVEYGLLVSEQLIRRGPFSAEFGKACVAELLEQGIPFDAVFALEDFTALGALRELQDRGVKVPEEVGVIGFANESFGTLVTPTLSSVDQQTVRMGEIAAGLFLQILEEKGPVASVMLDPILVPRGSSLR
jgi:LacI family transcriptional regulator